MNDLSLLAIPFVVAIVFFAVWLNDVRRYEADNAAHARTVRARRPRPLRIFMTPLAPSSRRDEPLALPASPAAPRLTASGARKLLPSFKKD